MASYVFNVAKGKVAAYFERVENNEPANSAIVIIPLKVSDTEANSRDFDTVTEVLAGTADEQTEGWSRKTLTDADLAGANFAQDDTNDRGQASVPEVKWTTPTSGKNTTGLLIAYDADTTGGNDSNLIPLVHVDFAVTADGNDVSLNAGEIFRAT